MNILLLTPQLPYPPIQGAAIRNYHLLRHLAREHRVSLLSFSAGEGKADLGDLPDLCAAVETIPTPVRTRRERLWAMLTSRQPDMALRLHSPPFADLVARKMEEQCFDVVQVEGIEMAHYALPIERTRRRVWRLRRERGLGDGGGRIGCTLGTIFDDHNAEYVLQQRAFETDVRSPRDWAKAVYSLIQWRRLYRYEASVVARYDRIIAVSEADKRALQALLPGLEVAVVPNGVDTRYFTSSLPVEQESDDLIFAGTMDYRPNVDAVLWFARAVLPLIWREEPNVRFLVVGLRPTADVQQLAADPRIVVTGGVPDVRPWLAEHGVFVVPMRVGGGTRIKVLEAMAMRKGIVSTSFGCEGIDVVDGKHLLLADDPQEFGRQCIRLLRDRRERERLGRQARELVVGRFDWRLITPLLSKVYESLVAADA